MLNGYLRSHSDGDAVVQRRVWGEWRFVHVHHSTAIEGNTLPYAAVRAFLETGVVPAGASWTETAEVWGCDKALGHVLRASRFWAPCARGNVSSPAPPPLSIELIKAIHRRVLFYDVDNAGVFRGVDVRVGSHRAPPWAGVPALMEELVAHWQGPAFAALHPVEQAALAHYEFVWVHPFVDGNGRTARLISSYLLMRAGLPPLNLLVTERGTYYRALEQASPASGACTWPLIDLFTARVTALTEEMARSVPATLARARQHAVEIGASGKANDDQLFRRNFSSRKFNLRPKPRSTLAARRQTRFFCVPAITE